MALLTKPAYLRRQAQESQQFQAHGRECRDAVKKFTITTGRREKSAYSFFEERGGVAD
jgi:hypothetical protein